MCKHFRLIYFFSSAVSFSPAYPPQLSFSLRVNFVEDQKMLVLFSSLAPNPKATICWVLFLSKVTIHPSAKADRVWGDEDWGSWRYEATTSWNLRFLSFFLAFCFHRDEKCYTSNDVFLRHDAFILKINKTSPSSLAATTLSLSDYCHFIARQFFVVFLHKMMSFLHSHTSCSHVQHLFTVARFLSSPSSFPLILIYRYRIFTELNTPFPRYRIP